MYFLYSMILTCSNKTVEKIFNITGSVITGDDVESFKTDYPLKDDDINQTFKERLINTIMELSNDDFKIVLKLLNEYGVI